MFRRGGRSFRFQFGSSMIVWSFLPAILTTTGSAQDHQCSTLTEKTKSELLRLVRFRYKLDLALPLQVESETRGDCFLHVRVHSEQGFWKAITITPDQKYAVSDLVDLGQDPAEEARRTHDEFVKRLRSEHAPVRGDNEAPVSIVIFSDFQCPYCKRAAEIIDSTLASERQVNLVFRQFPLPIHDWATIAAEASVCLARENEDLFWKAHDFMFGHQRELSRSTIIEVLAKEMKATPSFDSVEFQKCVDGHSAKEFVKAEIQFGLENDVRATPTIFVNGVRVDWAGNADQLKSFIRHASKENIK